MEFLAAQTKLQQAKDHFEKLRNDVIQFKESNPYELVEERRDGKRMIRVKINSNPPPKFAATAADVLHNLRSALDNLVIASIRNEGNVESKENCFPIFESKEKTDIELEKRIRCLGQPVRNYIESLKPYASENPVLWRLHSLNNESKHRDVYIVGGANISVLIDWSTVFKRTDQKSPFPPMNIKLQPSNSKWPIADGDILYEEPETITGSIPEFSGAEFGLLFNEANAAEGLLFFPAIEEMIIFVEKIILDFQKL